MTKDEGRRTPAGGLRVLLVVAGFALASGCAQEPQRMATFEPELTTLFTAVPAAYSGIDFENRLEDTQEFNVFTYRNYFNGGGVGLGDLNGDGLLDVYLTANQQDNRLYLGRGDFRFEDVTDAAGVAGERDWATGVSVADVNGDGLLDLYVSNAGNVDGDNTANELYINLGTGDDGIPRFEERAEELGLADRGYTTHAAFFDYDRDGDLDVYVLNNSFRPISSFGLRNIRHERHPYGGDKLYRNDGGRFTDVSEDAGIWGSEIGFGLGVTVGDVNGDGWPDLYVSNDFFERDYLYVNNQDGTFTDELEARMPMTSLFSMGADMADVDNDGYPEVYVTDMLPVTEERTKMTSTYESWDVYRAKQRNDYYYQFMRNTLHRNNADGTFTDVGLMAGTAATDWSWGALLADFDLDGFKDIFVSNGVYRDVTNQDFIDYLASAETMQQAQTEGVDYLALLDRIPSTPLPNALFRNQMDSLAGDLRFENVAEAWGVAEPSFSNGSAYGDLDNDGDLDLVVNNLNMPAFVYRNEADTLRQGHHYLQVALEGVDGNRFAVGTKVYAHAGGRTHYIEQVPMRGFQSSVDPVLTIGLGTAETVDSLFAVWPDGRRTLRTDVAANQRLTLRQADADDAGDAPILPQPAEAPLFAARADAAGLDFAHEENAFVDFDREPLMLRMVSTEGPALATADVNGDGREDVYFGGAKEQAGALYLQRRDGTFRPAAVEAFDRDAISEDVAAAFFDADNDGDADLYVVSGGSEFTRMAPALQDRLYLNDGRGGFTRAVGVLPTTYDSGGTVAPADYDGDGDTDLFVGNRMVPWGYGLMPHSRLLRNDRGRFTDITETAAPELLNAGMVTDAAWADLDGDGRLDLAVAGEWMPVRIFQNAGRGNLEATPAGLSETHGWWNRLLADDLDGDGDIDLVAGNLGLNTKLQASPDAPVEMVVHDFDGNGFTEQVVTAYRDGVPYPVELRRDLLKRLNFLKKRYVDFDSYAEQRLEDIFTPEELEGAAVRRAETFATTWFENTGDGTFEAHALPYDAQLAPVFGLLARDFDGDGHKDLLLAGNFFEVRPILGRMEGSRGTLLRGDGQGGFTTVPNRVSGLRFDGQIRRLALVETRQGPLVVAAPNDAPVQVWVPEG